MFTGQESALYDGKGNVTALVDGSESVVATYTYDTFGVLKAKTGSIDQPFRFSTKRYDEALGTSYYGYRFYSPALRRWITRDPIGELGGLNLYGFVGNNPVNFFDPYGLLLYPVPEGYDKENCDPTDLGNPLGAAYKGGNAGKKFLENLVERWKDLHKNKDKWRKTKEVLDKIQPKRGESVREFWERTTGEKIGVHRKIPPGSTRKGNPKHPHPFEP